MGRNLQHISQKITFLPFPFDTSEINTVRDVLQKLSANFRSNLEIEEMIEPAGKKVNVDKRYYVVATIIEIRALLDSP